MKTKRGFVVYLFLAIFAMIPVSLCFAFFAKIVELGIWAHVGVIVLAYVLGTSQGKMMKRLSKSGGISLGPLAALTLIQGLVAYMLMFVFSVLTLPLYPVFLGAIPVSIIIGVYVARVSQKYVDKLADDASVVDKSDSEDSSQTD